MRVQKRVRAYVHLNEIILNTWRVLQFLFVSVLLIESSYAATDSQSLNNQPVDSAWYYHLGDLNIAHDGSWQTEEVIWYKTESPETFSDRSTEKIVWIKTDLPSGDWRDPYLFISSVDLTLQVFFKGKMIYYFGEIDKDGNSQFEGWPWHAIPLPKDYDAESLYFRVYSDYPFIGLAGDIQIGNRFELLEQIYQGGAAGLLFVLMVLIIGVISTAIGLIKKDRKAAISTGVLSFNLSLMMFAENELSQVAYYDPLFWRYIAAFTYFLIPALLAIVISAWVKDKSPFVARSVRNVSFIFFFGVAGLSYFSDFNFVNAYPPFDVLFILLVTTLLFGYVDKFRVLGVPGILMACGVVALFGSLLIDMLNAHGFISWIGHVGQWGLILFTLASFLIYLVQDWHQQIDLSELTDKLETKVMKRTEQLQASEEKLKCLAREDYLTKLLNRRAFTEMAKDVIAQAGIEQKPLSLVLFDLDLFKRVNDQYGHRVGDLVLKAIADVIRQTCREGELICRFGGEEFVVLLPATNATFAQTLVKRLRSSISEMEVIENGEPIKVTASFGLISLSENLISHRSPEAILERLLAEADKIMYEAKEAGRDEIKFLELRDVVA